MKKITLLLLLICLNLFSQNNTIPISELKNDDLIMYQLLERAINLKVSDSTNTHFFSDVTLTEDKNSLIIQTFIYDKIYKNDLGYYSATYSASLSFDKFFEQNPNETYVIPNDTETIGNTTKPKFYKTSIIHYPNYPFDKTGKILFNNIESEKLFKNKNLMSSNADFHFKRYRNTVDFKTFSYLSENLIDNNNKHILSCAKYSILKIDNKYGIINNQNQILLPFDKNKITFYDEGLFVEEEDKNYFYDPINENVIHAELYKSIISFQFNDEKDLILLIKKFNDKYSLLNFTNKKEGKMFDSINTIGYGYTTLVVKDKGNYGAINYNNEILLNIKYDFIKVNSRNGNGILVKNNNKWALYNSLNKEFVTHFEYSDMDSTSGYFVIVEKKNKYGIIDFQGNEILPIKYDLIGFNFTTNIYSTTKNNNIERFKLEELRGK